MKPLRLLIPSLLLWGLLLSTASTARADNIGKLQFMYTAYLDVPALFPKTLAACMKLDPSTGPELQRLYDQWYQTHGRYQGELQHLLSAHLSTQMDEPQTQALIAHIKTAVQTELVPFHFPQDASLVDRGFCTQLLPRDLTGSDLMLNFADYVAEFKQPEPSAE